MSTIWVDLLGTRVHYVEAGGIRTRCIEAGDGPPLVLLHGVGGHAEAFARNVVPLSEHFRVLAIDYLGFGLTDSAHGEADLEAYIRHLLDFLDAVGAERAHLAGESLGGWIAAWAAILHPDRVDRLAFICGARLAVDTDEASSRHVDAGRAELRRLTDQLVADPTREHVRQRLNWLFRHPERDVTEELVDIRWKLYQRQEARESLGRSARSLGQVSHPEHLTPAELSRITAPTLILWTSHNPSSTAATAREAARHIPDCRFELMEDCGHWPQWEDPDTFNTILTDFLTDGNRAGTEP